MKNYYLDGQIEDIKELTGEDDGREHVKFYFKNNFTEDELLELLIRGQIHARDDERTNGYYDR